MIPLRHIIFWLAAMPLCCWAAVPMAAQETTARPESGLQYMPLVFTVEVDPEWYINPFDTTDIEVLGIFRGPSGADQIVPGFWMQPYEDRCAPPCLTEDLQPAGEPVWQVRFTPHEAGDWAYTLQVQDGGLIASVEDGTFTVLESDVPGFIRSGPQERYFVRSTGEAYFPLGHNLKWTWDARGGLGAYRVWLRDLAASGGNYARVFVDVPWSIGLDWAGPAGDYTGDQQAAARLDLLLDLAAAEGIALQLVLLWHQSLNYYSPPPVNIPQNPPRPDVSADWDNHPYNNLNGGPLSGPGVFFSDDRARELFRQRLRYAAARWGYSTAIFAWELVDAIDRVANYNAAAANDWLRSMASYLRRVDPHGHLITVGVSSLEPAVAENPLLDFTQTAFYQRLPVEDPVEQVPAVLRTLRHGWDARPVPTLMSAFSLNPWFEPTAADPAGLHFQQTLWAAVMSGAAGATGGDWWDSYILPQGLSRYYRPLADFASGVDWPRLNLRPAPSALLLADGGYLPLRVNDFVRQFLVAPSHSAVPLDLTGDGLLPGAESFSAYLYGQVFNNQLNRPQAFRLHVPMDTYLEVGVRSVSADVGAQLLVQVNGVDAGDLRLAPGTRNVALRVPLTAGEHLVVLDNIGDDWLELDYIEVGALVTPARVLTLRDAEAGVALAWLQHRGHTWEQGSDLPEALAAAYRLDGLPPGNYRVEVWNPLTGEVLGEIIVPVLADGVLVVELPPFNTQLAMNISRRD